MWNASRLARCCLSLGSFAVSASPVWNVGATISEPALLLALDAFLAELGKADCLILTSSPLFGKALLSLSFSLMKREIF